MAKLQRVAGSTSHVLEIFVQDSSSSTGAGLTGLVFNSAGLTCYYKRNLGTASVAVTLVTITTLGTYASGGFKEIDAANMPGVYEFHPPDAAYASGAKSVVLMLKGGANMAPVLIEVELTATDNQNVTGGLVLAKTTNLTGLNDIAATAVVTAGAITTAGGKVSGVALVDSLAANGDKSGYSLSVAPPTAGTIAAAVRDVDNTNPAASSLGADVNANTTTLGTINTNVNTINVNMAAFAGLFIAGTVSGTPSPTNVTVAVANSSDAAMMPGLYLNFVSSNSRAPGKLPIVTATATDGTHVALTFSNPGFGVVPQGGDSVLIG